MNLRQTVALGLLTAAPTLAQPVDPNGNLPLPPAELEQRLGEEPARILEAKGAGAGVTGAQKWRVEYADGLQLSIKWKPAPRGGDGWNNSPRLEMAAYRAQQLFLDPSDQVVPPVAAICLPLPLLQSIDADATPNIPGARCVFGTVSAWMHNVQVPTPAFDRTRFQHDPRYAYHFGNLNLFAYLIAHRDARANNFLMSNDPTNPQLFAIDNGIAFSGWFYNWFMRHFDTIRVAGLPRQSVERLRALPSSAPDGLGTVAQLCRDADGVLRTVPSSPALDPDSGVRVVGDTLQLGLTRGEIAALSKRLAALLRRVDTGKLSLF